MLGMIQQTLVQQLEQQDQNEAGIGQRLESNLAAKILIHLNQQELGRSEIATRLGHQFISGELNKQIKNLLGQQLIERAIPDKPTSSKQKYRLMREGRQSLL